MSTAKSITDGISFFFFQAEDGIRDYKVTGVQTCALPISKNGNTVGVFSLEMSAEQLVSRLLCSEARVDAHRLRTGYLNREEWARLADGLRKIGRASCRERV